MLVPTPPGIEVLADDTARIKALTDLAAARNAVRTTLIQAIAGALFFVTAFIAWRQVQATRSGQLTDRFTKTIEQLGSEKTEVRLGALYSLRQIAMNSGYPRPAAQILVAYLKSRSSTNPDHDKADGKHQGIQREPDLDAALEILVEEGLWIRSGVGRLDLSSVRIPCARLRRADLRGCILRNAILPRADLREAILDGSDLRGAYLGYSVMTNAQLEDAHLECADFTKASLDYSNLRGAHAQDAIFEGASLLNVDLSSADFGNARLSGAILNGAKADTTVNLMGADLNGATFVAAAIKEAILDEPISQQLPIAAKGGASPSPAVFARYRAFLRPREIRLPKPTPQRISVVVALTRLTVDLTAAEKLPAGVPLKIDVVALAGQLTVVAPAGWKPTMGRRRGLYNYFEGKRADAALREVSDLEAEGAQRVVVNMRGFMGSIVFVHLSNEPRLRPGQKRRRRR